jgi:hypothetical protein
MAGLRPALDGARRGVRAPATSRRQSVSRVPPSSAARVPRPARAYEQALSSATPRRAPAHLPREVEARRPTPCSP